LARFKNQFDEANDVVTFTTIGGEEKMGSKIRENRALLK